MLQKRIEEIGSQILASQQTAGLPPDFSLPSEEEDGLHRLLQGGIGLARAWSAERLAEEVASIQMWSLHLQSYINRQQALLHWLEKAQEALLGKILESSSLGVMWEERKLRAQVATPQAQEITREIAQRRASLEAVLWLPVRLDGLARAMENLLRLRQEGAKG